MEPTPDKSPEMRSQSRRSWLISLAASASLLTSCLTLAYIAGPAAFQHLRNAISPPSPPPTPPSLADYTSERMGGGSDPYHACYPTLDRYQKRYPNYQIRVQSTNENSDKDWLGHVTYQYHCSFIAVPLGQN